MRKHHFLLSLFFFACITQADAQTDKAIQGTWRVLSTTITNDKGEQLVVMDSSTHNLTKVITANRFMFTIYDRKTDSLLITGQGKATTRDNQYIETLEHSTSKTLLEEPMVFTYKIEGNKLRYEGGKKTLHIVEVLQRME